jgi:hypothetical protein
MNGLDLIKDIVFIANHTLHDIVFNSLQALFVANSVTGRRSSQLFWS